MMDRGLEPGRLLREPGQHEGAGGDPCDEDRDGDDGEQNEECGHGGVGSVKSEMTESPALRFAPETGVTGFIWSLRPVPRDRRHCLGRRSSNRRSRASA
jgi:hypothetical protein